MPYRLKGTLKAPNGQPLTGVDLQFIAQQTLSPVLQQTDHNIRLGADGSYDVSLEFNIYAVKAQIGGLAPQHMGYIKVDADTPAGLDLPQLLRLYSQEATAPDYAKMIEEWLKEAKAAADTATTQATSAKAQADRAKAEADRASQITGLDTVADAIGLAAVPFPDVWIPFNDSLRMLAGFGRDVKVGSDVVATYVNYERATTATYTDKSGVMRTAAINEPRFEKEGLLIEGQSTNLCHFSNDFSLWGSNGGHELEVVGDGYTKFTMTTSQSGGRYVGLKERLVVGRQYTLSFWAYSEDARLPVSIGVESSFMIKDITSTPTRHSMTITANKESATLVIYNGAGKPCVFFIRGMQLEESPFASSYIPTNGAAVTRAADKCWIQAELNNGLNGDGNIKTVAVTSDILGSGSAYNFIVNTPWGAIDYTKSAERVSSQDVSLNLRSPIVASEISVKVAVFNGRNGSGYLNGGKTGSKSGNWMSPANDKIQIGHYNNGVNFHFGHIRDLKIWHHALSDAQIKGLK